MALVLYTFIYSSIPGILLLQTKMIFIASYLSLLEKQKPETFSEIFSFSKGMRKNSWCHTVIC